MACSAGRSRNYAPADLDEHGLDAAVPAPVGEDGQLGMVDLSVSAVDEGQVDTREKLHHGRLIGVGLAAVDFEAVDAVLVHGLARKAR